MAEGDLLDRAAQLNGDYYWIQYPPGTRVARGQFIAQAGSTGYSSGPHLHFVIQQNVGMELRSIPFEFADSRRRAFTPVAGMVLRR